MRRLVLQRGVGGAAARKIKDIPAGISALKGFFAHLDDYRAQIESLITDRFHFIGKQNPQAP